MGPRFQAISFLILVFGIRWFDANYFHPSSRCILFQQYKTKPILLTFWWVFISENLFFDKRKSWKKSSFSENYLKLCSGAVYKTEMVFIYPCFYKYLSLLKIWPIIPRHFFKMWKIKIIMQNINCVKLTYVMMIFSLNKVW